MLATALELAWTACAVLAAWLGIRIALLLLRRKGRLPGATGPGTLLHHRDVQGMLGFGLAAWVLAQLLHRINMA
ncbi:MAG: hypothetical protein B7Z53_00085 [Rhodospirillales bacterium 12-71-4]|nr:MAG: hypothetical protein B7Z53_00085 [Rhodospirillales bacterium 12-71-4]